jgi:polar amino acid transport system substrate-binding protein
LGACTITSSRENRIDFSDQYYRSGLRIVINRQEDPWYLFLIGFFSPSIFKAFTLIACVLIIGGFLMWCFERERADSEVKTIELGIQLAFETGSTIGHGFLHPKSRGGRFVGYFVFVFGAICFGNLISDLTAEKTISRMNRSITCPADLANKKVATVQGTTTVNTVKSLEANVIACPKEGDAMFKLLIGEADAVVYDWPALAYYLTATSAGTRCEAVGNLFDIQYYGVAFPNQSALREKFNIALSTLRERQEYQEIYQKWFPNDKE